MGDEALSAAVMVEEPNATSRPLYDAVDELANEPEPASIGCVLLTAEMRLLIVCLATRPFFTTLIRATTMN